jgi:hypothetical protein
MQPGPYATHMVSGRVTSSTDRTRVGPRSIRLLEEAGIHGLDELVSHTVEDLVRLGVRRDLAKQIRAYVSTCLERGTLVSYGPQ